jgi:hypothetical protein
MTYSILPISLLPDSDSCTKLQYSSIEETLVRTIYLYCLCMNNMRRRTDYSSATAAAILLHRSRTNTGFPLWTVCVWELYGCSDARSVYS